MLRKFLKKNLLKNDKLYSFVKYSYFKILITLTALIPDKLYLQVQFFVRTLSFLNIDNPVTFNEKIQWYKLYYRNPLLKVCVDKWEVRDYVKKKGLSDILIPAYGPYGNIHDIDFDMLPEPFIVKMTNGSGFNEICFNKKSLNVDLLRRVFRKWMNVDFCKLRREWAYEGVQNRIVCEELIHDANMSLPSDIRFFCFFGRVKLIAVDLESVVDGKKTSNYYRHLFTSNWEAVEATIQYPAKDNISIKKPDNFGKMIEIAETLSSDFPFVRVDLYNVDGKVFFGELTFYHASGYQEILPRSFEVEMGEWFDLSKIVYDIK